MEENIYKKARLKAAQKDPELRTADKAFPKVCMSREKLMMIEQEDPSKRQAIPNPGDIVMMAKVYDAPELRDYYCTHHCPIGQDRKALVYDNLSEISTGLLASMYFLDHVSDQIHRILEDSQVTAEEKQEFAKSLAILRKIAYSANCLELWAKKNNLTD